MWEKFKYTDEERTLGIIYLVRDPRDIVISYAHHMNKKIERGAQQTKKKKENANIILYTFTKQRNINRK